jgi:hypothetical protein
MFNQITDQQRKLIPLYQMSLINRDEFIYIMQSMWSVPNVNHVSGTDRDFWPAQQDSNVRPTP